MDAGHDGRELPKKVFEWLVRAFDEERGNGFEFIQDSLKRAEMGLFRAFLLGCGCVEVTIW